MTSQYAKKFGEKYVLYDLLGIGGMAEVYRAKLLRDKGFEKQVVIKRLLPQIAKDREMVDLFIGEARLAALLQHENIAATYDFGEIDQAFFLAMEYLAGVDLYTFLQKSRELGRPVDVAQAVFVVMKICEGMDYAHKLTDMHGNPLHLIHRDLTPHNIFITYDGKVKVFDFGVAKAEMLDNKTKVGVVKGKLSYMSPEQVMGEGLDHRSDIFSIGILLYEMLTGVRMYKGDTAELITRCAAADYKNIREVAPSLPPALCAIIDRALARQADARYQSCMEMQADLDSLLVTLSERPSSHSLKAYVLDLFREEYEADRQKTIEMLAEPVEAESAAPQREKTLVMDAGISRQSAPKILLPKRLAATLQQGKWKVLGGVLLFCAGGIFFATFLADHGKDRNFPRQRPPVGRDGNISPAGQAPDRAVRFNQMKELRFQAQKALVDGRLSSPPQDNALQYYLDILQLDPHSAAGLAGLEQVAERYIEKARTAVSAGDYIEAARTVAEAEAAFSGDDPVFTSLAQRLEQEKQQIIDGLEGRAKRALATNRLTEPDGHNAFYYYSAIFGFAPASKTASAGLNAIAVKCAGEAEDALRAHDIELAQKYVEQGLQVAPDSPELLVLQKKLMTGNDGGHFFTLASEAYKDGRFPEALRQVDAGLATYPDDARLSDLRGEIVTAQKTTVDDLIKIVRRCLYENKLTDPADDSALLYLNRIQGIDPGNPFVREGYKEIADRYASLADESYRIFELEKARAYVEKGLAVMPGHPRLLSLKRDLSRSVPGKLFKGIQKNVKSIFAN